MDENQLRLKTILKKNKRILQTNSKKEELQRELLEKQTDIRERLVTEQKRLQKHLEAEKRVLQKELDKQQKQFENELASESERIKTLPIQERAEAKLGLMTKRDKFQDVLNKKREGLEKRIEEVQVQLQEDMDVFQNKLKEELLKHPGVENVSAASTLPNRIMSSASGSAWEGKNDEETFLVHYDIVDYDFIETFKIEMAEGRSFSQEFSDEENFGVLLNEEAIKQMGLEDPIGKEYSFWGNEGEIVGVMKDFHFKSLHNPIEPMLFMVFKDYVDYLVVRINAENSESTISFLEDTMAEFDPENSHEFRFFDERYNAMYNSEQQMGIILKIFTGLAIFIACLGLFGLSTFMTQQRTKEIGIRKVLGANVPNIVIILSKEFTKWVIIANLIACPVAYFILKTLLQNFAYRVEIGYQVFVVTIIASIAIAVFTVSFQTIKAANANPADVIKYE